MRSFFAMDREESLYNEIALHIMTIFPNLEKDALSDIPKNSSIKQFDTKQAECMLALLCEDINEKNNTISESDFNTIIGEYAALFQDFNKKSFEKISNNFPKNQKNSINDSSQVPINEKTMITCLCIN